MAEQLLSLVDYIAYCAKCRSVSQLHYMTSLEKRHALYGMDRVKEDTYPLEQWNEALTYIMKVPPVDTIGEARAILEAFLRDEDQV